MNLREYIDLNMINITALARRLKVQSNYFHQIVREERTPSTELAEKIELITGGQVTVPELRKELLHG